MILCWALEDGPLDKSGISAKVQKIYFHPFPLREKINVHAGQSRSDLSGTCRFDFMLAIAEHLQIQTDVVPTSHVSGHS